MIEFNFAVLVALTTGVTEILKQIIGKNRFIPLISLFVGVCLSIAAYPSREGILLGIAVGLSSSGLYSGTKKLIKK